MEQKKSIIVPHYNILPDQFNLGMIGSEMTVTEFVDGINQALANGTTNPVEILAFIYKLKGLIKVLEEDNEVEFKQMKLVVEKIIEEHSIDILGTHIKMGASQSWIDLSTTGDLEYLALIEIKKQVDSRLKILEKEYKTTVKEKLKKKEFSFGVETITKTNQVPSIVYKETTYNTTLPTLKQKNGLEIITI